MSITFALPGRRTAAALTVAALSVALAGCGGGSGDKTKSGPTATATGAAAADSMPALGSGPSTIATARHKTVDIYKNTTDGTPDMRLHSPNPEGVRRVFLVIGSKPGWLHVLLPVAPNGSKGWIHDDQVTTAKTGYWLQVQKSAHRLKVYKGKKLLIDTPAAIGKTDTPTPGGRYYLTELLKAPNPKGAYGPYAYGLSGQSDALKKFDGHDPIIGIHGTNQPKLLGTSVSHGCVRVGNKVITRLAKMLPLGTPVEISA